MRLSCEIGLSVFNFEQRFYQWYPSKYNEKMNWEKIKWDDNIQQIFATKLDGNYGKIELEQK